MSVDSHGWFKCDDCGYAISSDTQQVYDVTEELGNKHYCKDKNFCYSMQAESIIIREMISISDQDFDLRAWWEDSNPYFENRRPMNIDGKDLLALILERTQEDPVK